MPAKVEEDETPPPYEEVSATVENAEAEKKPEEEEQELSDELRKNSLEIPQIVETVEEEEQNEVHLEESPTKDIECNIQHVEVTVEQVPDEIPEPQLEQEESIEDIEPKIKEVELKNEAIVEPSEVIFEPSEAKMDEKLEFKEPVAQESEELEDSLEFTDEHHNNNNNEVDDEEVKSPIVLPPTEVRVERGFGLKKLTIVVVVPECI